MSTNSKLVKVKILNMDGSTAQILTIRFRLYKYGKLHTGWEMDRQALKLIQDLGFSGYEVVEKSY